MLRMILARAGFLVVGALMLVLAIGFSFNMAWVSPFWPWPDGRLSFLFVGSVLGALGAGSLYVGATREFRAAIGGGITFAIAGAAFCLYLGWFGPATVPGIHPLAFGAMALIGLLVLVTSLNAPAGETRRPPIAVILSCWVFAAALLIAAVMLVLRYPHVFPWPLSPDTSSLYGWMFFALSANHAYVAWRGTRSDAIVSLIAFLVYDLILIGPFVAHFGAVKPEHLPSLVIYVAVLVYSGVLSVVYLLSVMRRHPARAAA